MPSLTDLLEGSLVWLYIEIHLKDGSHYNRKECEDEIEECNGPWRPEGLTRTVVEAVCKLDNGEYHVFVEWVKNHFAYPDVIQATIMQYKFPKNAELTDCIIRYLGSLSPLLTKNTHSYMSLGYHVCIISTITYCKGDLSQLFYQFDDFCLLCRSDPAKNHRVDSRDYMKQILLVLGKRYCRPIYDRTDWCSERVRLSSLFLQFLYKSIQ